MSKSSVKKSIKDFEAPQLQELILDLYGKSKEVKEILDFFANPDIEKKSEDYKSVLYKEATRYSRRGYRPRMPRLRTTIKRFRVLLEPGDEAVADLMVFVALALIGLGEEGRHRDTLYDNIGKFVGETFVFLSEHGMLDDYMPQFRKAMSRLKPLGIGILKNPMLRVVESEFEKVGRQV